MTGVTTRERGDDGPGKGETDFNGVLHAERGCSGLEDVPRRELDVDDRLELMDGKWSREDDDVLRVVIGLGCTLGSIASGLRGLMLVPASIGSGTNRGETCTFSFEIGIETRGYWRPFGWWGGDNGVEGVDLDGEDIGVPGRSSKSPSNTPSSTTILCRRASSSSRESINTYSTASNSERPSVSNVDLCSRSRPCMRCVCALSYSSST